MVRSRGAGASKGEEIKNDTSSAAVTSAILLGGFTAAHAATLVTGVVAVDPDEEYRCGAVNLRTTRIASMKITVSFLKLNGDDNGGTQQKTCINVARGEGCIEEDFADPGASVMYCTIEVSGGKKGVVGSLCNLSKGACSDAK